MPEDFHVDMSGKLSRTSTVGIACLSPALKLHSGCALSGELLKDLRKKLFAPTASLKRENAKIYAICIYLLINDRRPQIKRLIICNDENFELVKAYLSLLLEPNSITFEIINIGDLRKIFGRNFKSPADKYANKYRQRALEERNWEKGTALSVVKVDYKILSDHLKSLE
ncbi:MAG TPA: hypothetical protein VNF06_02525 [Candidatus Aquilonibacter sp.]|nr:hypothetical protein [Candidatus Aquilonibacter sp.]